MALATHPLINGKSHEKFPLFVGLLTSPKHVWKSQIQTLGHVVVIQPISFLATAILILRYITLSYCIALRTVSFRLKKRFPTIDHLVHAGVMRQVFNIIFKLHCSFDENQDYCCRVSLLLSEDLKIANVNFQAGAVQAAGDHYPHNHKHCQRHNRPKALNL